MPTMRQGDVPGRHRAKSLGADRWSYIPSSPFLFLIIIQRTLSSHLVSVGKSAQSLLLWMKLTLVQQTLLPAS